MSVSLTEDEWLTTTDGAVLWESDYLWGGKTSARKYQLYAVAWCRRIWDLFPTDQARRIVDTLEQVADGFADEAQLEIAWRMAVGDEDHPHAGLNKAQSYALSAAITCCFDKEYRLAGTAASYCLAALAAHAGQELGDCEAEGQSECDLIRELFPNPFKLPIRDPDWFTTSVISLAQTAGGWGGVFDAPASAARDFDRSEGRRSRWGRRVPLRRQPPLFVVNAMHLRHPAGSGPFAFPLTPFLSRRYRRN